MSTEMRLNTAIGLVSAAVVAFQLCLMQILSIVQWHHYAAMVIALALLGFGASGTCITLLQERLLRGYASLLPVFLLACGAAMAFSVGTAMTPPVRFDAMLVLARPQSSWRLTLTCLVFFTPFFLGAMAIGLAFVRHVRAIGRLYCSNLVGSGLGSLLAVALMWGFLPERMPGLIAILPVLAGIIMCGTPRRAAAACLALVPAAWVALYPPELAMSEFKALSKALDMPGSTIVCSRNSPYGLMQVVSSPSLRFAPGLSLERQALLPAAPAVFRNGDWFGPVPRGYARARADILDSTTTGLPYALGDPRRVLVLDAGTGADAAQALTHGAEVWAVEQNPFAVDIMQDNLESSRLRVLNTGSRTFLMRYPTRFDLIVLPMIDAFGGTGGLYALSENYLLTVEAIGQMWNRLSPRGMLSASCWMDYPPRASLKLLATLAEVLERSGVDPRAHIVAVRSWGTLTFAVQMKPIAPGDVERTGRFCDALGFDPVLLPGLEPSRRERFHALQDAAWFDNVDAVLSLKRQDMPYDFDIRPATDDRPYFSQFLTEKSLARLSSLYGIRAIPFFEISYLVLIATALQITALAFVLIVLPLMKIGRSGKTRTLLYFGGIGIGYMLIEIVLIQRFVLYLGNLVYAAAAVIGAMLIFSGAGSYVSPHLRSVSRYILAGIPCLVLAGAFALPPLLHGTISLPLAARVGIMLLFIAPPAFLMGMPFALGISAIGEDQVPWAWGVNGCLSVVSTPLATIIAVELGFAWVMILAACAYGVTFLSTAGRH